MEQPVCNCINLQNLGLAVNGLHGSEAGPRPAALTGITLNSYTFPSIRPLTMADGLGDVVSNAFSHSGLYLSFISMMYPVIGVPPSDTGSAHFSSTWFADQSSGSGVPGLPAVAVGNVTV